MYNTTIKQKTAITQTEHAEIGDTRGKRKGGGNILKR